MTVTTKKRPPEVILKSLVARASCPTHVQFVKIGCGKDIRGHFYMPLISPGRAYMRLEIR